MLNSKKRLIGTLTAQLDAVRAKVDVLQDQVESLAIERDRLQDVVSTLRLTAADIGEELADVQVKRSRERHAFDEERDFYAHRISALEEVIRRSLPDQQIAGYLRDAGIKIP